MRDGKVTTDKFIFSDNSDKFKYENFGLALNQETSMIVVFNGTEHEGGFSVGSKYGSDAIALDYLADVINVDYYTLLKNKALVDYIQRMVKKTGGYLTIDQ